MSGSKSYPLFVDAALSNPLTRKRGLFFLLVPLPLMGICLHMGQGILGLFVMAIGFWPFPFRCRLEEHCVRISWFLVSEHIAWSDIRNVELGKDLRRGVVGKRGWVLAIERRNGSWTRLRGRPEVLSELASRMAVRLERVGEAKETSSSPDSAATGANSRPRS
jgi:hypothetical protein